jgi:tRNA(Met) C34 N-acetyltransferase TmcA
MLRPISDAARALAMALRRELARELPRQLLLLEEEGEVLVQPELREALMAGLGPAAPLPAAERDALVRAYASGPRTFESVATTVAEFVAAHPDALATLAPVARALIEARAVRGEPWPAVMRAAGQPSIPAAMRALRRAVRALLAAVRAHAADGSR